MTSHNEFLSVAGIEISKNDPHASLCNLTGPQLIAIYNSFQTEEDEIKKFTNKQAGLARVLPLVENLIDQQIKELSEQGGILTDAIETQEEATVQTEEGIENDLSDSEEALAEAYDNAVMAIIESARDAAESMIDFLIMDSKDRVLSIADYNKEKALSDFADAFLDSIQDGINSTIHLEGSSAQEAVEMAEGILGDFCCDHANAGGFEQYFTISETQEEADLRIQERAADRSSVKFEAVMMSNGETPDSESLAETSILRISPKAYDLIAIIVNDYFRDGRDPINNPVWTRTLAHPFGATLGGIITQAQKSGFIGTQKSGKDSTIWVTQLGMDAFNGKSIIRTPGTRKTKSSGEPKGKLSKFSGRKLFPVSSTNPRRPQSYGFTSLQIIIDNPGISYEEFTNLGGRRQDLQWDIDHGSVNTAA